MNQVDSARACRLRPMRQRWISRDNVRVHRGAVEIIASQNRGAGVSVWNVLLSRCLPQLTCFDHACACARHCLRHVSLSVRLMRESSRFCTSMSSAPNATPMDYSLCDNSNSANASPITGPTMHPSTIPIRSLPNNMPIGVPITMIATATITPA